jgi:hypothetical protein
MKRAGMVAVLAALLAPALVLADSPNWKPVGELPIALAKGKFVIKLPDHWMYQAGPMELESSLHGSTLDRILVIFQPRSRASTTTDTESFAQDLLNPHEQRDDRKYRLESLLPAVVAGREGYRAEYTSVSVSGTASVEYRHVVYGVKGPKGNYSLSYAAPAIHYYRTSLPLFEAAVKTLVLR